VAIGAFWAAAWLIWIAGIRGWQPQGSLALIFLGQLVLLAGTAAISAMLVALSKETSTALAVCAVYAGSALAYSGGSLPVQGASLFARGWSGFLPFTHYLDLQMDQWLGAPAWVASRQLAILSLYLLVPMLVTLVVLRRERPA
jgi:ABC-2 type transport system permease protein